MREWLAGVGRVCICIAISAGILIAVIILNEIIIKLKGKKNAGEDRQYRD